MEREPLEITEIRVKLTGDGRSKLRAFCSVTLCDQFVVRDVKVIEGAKGPFVAMPSRKLADRCTTCGHKNHLRASFCNQCGHRLDTDRVRQESDGRLRLHADLAHPINSECRIRLHKAIVQAFLDEVEKSQQEGYKPASFDDLDLHDDFDDDDYVQELQRRQRERDRHRGQASGGQQAGGAEASGEAGS